MATHTAFSAYPITDAPALRLTWRVGHSRACESRPARPLQRDRSSMSSPLLYRCKPANWEQHENLSRAASLPIPGQ